MQTKYKLVGVTLIISCSVLTLNLPSRISDTTISNLHEWIFSTNASNGYDNLTCAEAILRWCTSNHIDISNCSWSIGTFRNHFYNMAALISKPFPESVQTNRGLAFIRLGDGEMLLMFGIAVKGIDNWLWPGGRSRLGEDLRKAIGYSKYHLNSVSPFYYGIYDANNVCSFHELLTMIHQHPKYLTYTNLFVNSNYPATKLLHQSLIKDERKKIILIINNGTSAQKMLELHEWTAEILHYPTEGPLMWENDKLREEAIRKIVTVAKRYRNRLFAFSVGPLSRVLIHYAWLENPYNRYIDFGSTLDEMTKNRITRPYQTNRENFQDPTYLVIFNISANKFHVKAT